MNIFSKINVENKNGVLDFFVLENAVINEIFFEGNNELSKENILKENEVVNGKEITVEKKETTRGLILVQDSKTRGAYGICKSKDTYILVEPFFGTNNEEALKFSVESDVVNLFIDFIKEM